MPSVSIETDRPVSSECLTFFVNNQWECPFDNCRKAYKSYAGLEYHIKHYMHANAEPAFLAAVLSQVSSHPPDSPRRDSPRAKKQEYSNAEIFPGFNAWSSTPVIYSDHFSNEDDGLLKFEPILSKVNMNTVPKASFRSVPPSEIASAKKAAQSVADLLLHRDGDDASMEHLSSRPSTYVRYVEMAPEEAYAQVEYDMDDEDQHWLQLYNEERMRSASLPPVPAFVFELIMDHLEKEWACKSRVKKELESAHVYPEESVCDICQDNECENSNAIVFCDGCNLAVHQDCYGVPYIPEGQWLCRKCLLAPEKVARCIFCTTEGGAMKQTRDNRWCHVWCALWIPEVCFANSVYMEPIDGVENVPKARWRLQCSLCAKRGGASIQCAQKNCFTAFHPSCGRRAGLDMQLNKHYSHSGEDRQSDNESDNHDADHEHAHRDADKNDDSENEDEDEDAEDEDEDGGLKAYCAKHTQGYKPPAIQQSDATATNMKAFSNTAVLGPAPLHIASVSMMARVTAALSSYSLQRKASVLASVARYWSLKRQSRRNAPLLRRLHYPSTSAGLLESSVALNDKSFRTTQEESIKYLRLDLEKVRILAEMVRRREKLKCSLLSVQREIVESILHPKQLFLSRLLSQLQSYDPKGLFSEPVDAAAVPDYYVVIVRPMDFQTMRDKVKENQYATFDSFKDDFLLICKNAMTYNRPLTMYFKWAQRLLEVGQQILDNAQGQWQRMPLDDKTGYLKVAAEDLDQGKLGWEKLDSIIREEEARKLEKLQREESKRHLVASQETPSSPSSQEQQDHKKRKLSQDKSSSQQQRPASVLSTPLSKGSRQGTMTRAMRTPNSVQDSPTDALSTHTPRPDQKRASSSTALMQSRASSFSSSPLIRVATLLAEKQEKSPQRKTDMETRYRVGDYVWAKLPLFPWFPAQIIHPEDRDNGQDIKATMPKNKKGKHHCVLFFDRQDDARRTWAWMTVENMLTFGHPERDKEMLILKDKSKRKNVLIAYKRALVHLEGEN